MSLYHYVEIFYHMHAKSEFVVNIFMFVLLLLPPNQFILLANVFIFEPTVIGKFCILSPLFHNVHSIDVTSFIIILLGGADRRNSTVRFHILQKATGFA